MTASRLAQARELLGSHTITDIATKLGVSRRTLYAHMRRIRPSAQAHRGTGVPTRTAGR
jgi:transposase-like protein